MTDKSFRSAAESEQPPEKKRRMSGSVRWSPPGKVVIFGSGHGIQELSNFHRCDIRVDEKAATVIAKAFNRLFTTAADIIGWRFWSAEHLWQCLKCEKIVDARRFTVDGDIGNCSDVGIEATLKRLTVGAEYWTRIHAVGITAKLAIIPKNAQKVFGLTLAKRYVGDFSQTERAIWLEILRLKYEQNDLHRRVLMSTGSDYLVEYTKPEDRTAHWGTIPLFF